MSRIVRAYHRRVRADQSIVDQVDFVRTSLGSSCPRAFAEGRSRGDPLVDRSWARGKSIRFCERARDRMKTSIYYSTFVTIEEEEEEERTTLGSVQI